jgi:acetyl-CoA synthetase
MVDGPLGDRRHTMTNPSALIKGLIDRQMAAPAARELAAAVERCDSPAAAWAMLTERFLTPAVDFSLHEWLYETIYASAPHRPAWLPPAAVVAQANVTATARDLALPDYAALHQWSVQNREAYWRGVIDRLRIRLREPFSRLVDCSQPTRPRWLVGAKLNIVDSCFQADPQAIAIIESDGSGPLQRYTYDALSQITARVAGGLQSADVSPGETVAVIMPMSFRSIAIYLGVIAAGAAVISIADSFAAEEIALRLRLANARLVFTQDFIRWGAKQIPLYSKIQAAKAPATIVVSTSEQPATLRHGDLTFEAFISDDDVLAPVPRSAHDPVNILFSSGTTGEPKVIPWDHTTPIKCAADAHYHQDLHPGDLSCWPTNLGWMMGPWLIFASLINRGAMAIYTQAPTDMGFGRFVQDAGVNMLGLVPSLVRAWRQSQCMRGLNWSAIRAFSSSGECSNPGDMLYLMHLAGYRPVIEYCGGTEIGGAYVTGTVVHPCTPATFTTPALGLDFVLLDENHQPADEGEAFIVGPSIGLSTRLLNRDNDGVYFAGNPVGSDGRPLRRHGDELKSIAGVGFRVVGRSDDTMNLGGIKVGCADIERVLNRLPGVHETAAVAIPPAGGGPSRLVVFLVPSTDATLPTAEAFKPLLQEAVRSQLNPLFHIDAVRIVASLPRTASNKILRRELRAMG